jgi:DNA-binding transcriptional ArsR family regulator
MHALKINAVLDEKKALDENALDENALDETTLDDTAIDDTLTALAEPTRRRVVELLRDGPLRAGDIADHLGMSPAATSRHLRTLHDHGVVEVSTDPDDARGRIYALHADRLVALSAWLDQVHANWSERLDAFRDLAERREGAA